MKRGAKRPALDTEPDLRSKRVMDTPSFNAHRAEPSHQPHLMAGSPPLDAKRAESSRQHVRALNTQFASWIQLQLQNHPDELWEDGVKDYLSHASHIMEKFKDVVEWLRENAAKSKSIGISIAGSTSRQNNFMASSEHNKPTLRTDINNGFAQVGTSASFPSLQNSDSLFNSQNSGSLFNSQSTGLFSSSQNSGSLFNSQSSGSLSSSQSTGLFSNSQSTGLFSNSQITGLFSNSQSTGLFTSSPSSSLFSSIQTPSFPGNQTSTSPKVEASDVTDEENELEKPSSPSLKRTQEQGIVVVHEVKCKVYVKPDNPADKGWKDIGVGQLSIKCKEGVSKATKESKPTIVIRNDVGKILLNALIYPGIKMNIQKKTIASIFHTSGGSNGDGTAAGDGSVTMARAYLLRMKTEEETTKLATAIEEYAPSA